MLNLPVEILNIVISGPTTHKPDKFGEDLRYRKSQDIFLTAAGNKTEMTLKSIY